MGRFEVSYDGSLTSLFTLLARFSGDMPQRPVDPADQEQLELFSEPLAGSLCTLPGYPATCSIDLVELYEVSVQAYDTCLYAWMSECAIPGEIIRFAKKVLATAKITGRSVPGGMGSFEVRVAAEQVLTDRGDPGTKVVLEAAAKVRHEQHRLMGFLRFSPNKAGIYTARCAPDHFTLPILARHFTLRFGTLPWAIIDEKRRISLMRTYGEEPRLISGVEIPDQERRKSGSADVFDAGQDWEQLWRQYHRSINQENRKRLALQRQFMPVRYWRYLVEMTEPE
ncbi:MAG: TIGR03915 family putative DNA repair protein [Treponema sp.]|nr:TIGR03915 family putative DNA repair protein [Treponema sp.]